MYIWGSGYNKTKKYVLCQLAREFVVLKIVFFVFFFFLFRVFAEFGWIVVVCFSKQIEEQNVERNHTKENEANEPPHRTHVQ